MLIKVPGVGDADGVAEALALIFSMAKTGFKNIALVYNTPW